MGMAECAKEAIYLERFIRELGLEDLGDITVYCDNKGSLKLVENPTFHARSRHIDIRDHFVRDAIRDRSVFVAYIPTEDQVADVMTKGLPRPKHELCLRLMGLQIGG